MLGIKNVLGQVVAFVYIFGITLEERMDRVVLVFAFGRFVLRVEGDQIVAQFKGGTLGLAAVSAHHANIAALVADRNDQRVADLVRPSRRFFLFTQAQNHVKLRKLLGTSL